MEYIINISIKNKIAVQTDNKLYICGNSDFVISFDFDDEWNEHRFKTARFIYGGNHTDVVFEGNRCPVPVISNTHHIKVGVFAGDLKTSTPAHVGAKKSILCESGTPVEPTPDVYGQMVEMFAEGMKIADEVQEHVASAEQAKLDAQAAQRSAEAAQDGVEANAIATAESASAASGSATRAEDAAVAAGNYKQKASESASAAAKSESDAASSKEAAALSAQNAAGSEQAAEISAKAAEESAETAKQNVESALREAKNSGEFDGKDGDPGRRGTGILKVTTAPSTYTTAIGDYTPKYRMKLSTVTSQSQVPEVLVGDIITHSSYLYPVDYVSDTYAYISQSRVSIKGAAGDDGVSPTVQVRQFPNGAEVTITDKDGEHRFLISDGYSVLAHVSEFDGGHRVTIEDAENEQSFEVLDGHTPVKSVDYWTDEDKLELVNDVLAALPTWEGGSF